MVLVWILNGDQTGLVVLDLVISLLVRLYAARIYVKRWDRQDLGYGHYVVKPLVAKSRSSSLLA